MPARDDARRFTARLSSRDHGLAGRVAAMLPSLTPTRSAAILSRASRSMSGDDARRAAGAAHFLAGHDDHAAAAFASIRAKTASDWNDLAAATIEQSRRSGREESWAAALAVIEEALARDPLLPEALFNRAVVLEHFGVTHLVPGYWRTYVTADVASSWGAQARRRLASGATPPPPKFAMVPAPQLPLYSRAYPQEARAAGEGPVLIAWAQAPTEEEGERHLDRAQRISEALQNNRGGGDQLIADAIAAIRTTRNAAALKAGHSLYGEGRLALRLSDHAGAERLLRQSADRFREGGSAMAAAAEVYMALAIRNQTRSAEALTIFARVLASERAAGGRHRGLIARIQHEIALCEAERGRWSASLAAAEEAMRIFEAMGESGNAAAAQAIVSEDYDYLGQRERAWPHGVAALRGACAARNVERARVVLAALTRIEMRARQWRTARAICAVERTLAATASNPRLDTGLRLRAATIDAQLGRFDAADRTIETARGALANVPDQALRAKLTADVDAAAGTIARRQNPHAALALLTSVIGFQQRAARPIVLPELYLERGRANRAIGNAIAAELDFEAGIRELERQRTRITEAELRPGLFDDAAELFHEAVALQIERGAEPSTVLAYIERGRARAVLEQIDTDDESAHVFGTTNVADVQRSLGPNAALLEFMALHDRLVILGVMRHRLFTRVVRVTRPALRRAAAARDWRGLYDVLIRPVAADLAGVTALTIVPDDVLQRVPFAALLDRQTNRYVVDSHTLATAPSAGVFVLTTERLRRTAARAPERLLVFANPSFSRTLFPDLPSLAAAEQEAASIARRYGNARTFLRKEATVQRFIDLAPSCSVVHFAGHGVVHERDPGSSALLCAATPDTDGVLRLRDIARLRFGSTETVVLAACSTMTGRNAAIEGVPSLARAFVIAGVPSVVGTLWDVKDGDAAPLMRALHEQLSRGVSAPEALRSAQLAAIAADQPVERWAAFAVTGAATSSRNAF